MLILVLNLLARIKLGRPTWRARYAPRLCVGGPMEESELWNSHYLEVVNNPCHWLLLLRCWCDWDQQKEIPVPIFGELSDISDEDASSVEGHEDEEEVVLEDDAPHPFSQKELNDLVRDLSLLTDSAKLLASRLKEKASSLTGLASASSATGIKSSAVFLNSKGRGVPCRYCPASAQA